MIQNFLMLPQVRVEFGLHLPPQKQWVVAFDFEGFL